MNLLPGGSCQSIFVLLSSLSKEISLMCNLYLPHDGMTYEDNLHWNFKLDPGRLDFFLTSVDLMSE